MLATEPKFYHKENKMDLAILRLPKLQNLEIVRLIKKPLIRPEILNIEIITLHLTQKLN
jgi:hypothetical protein